MMNVLRQAAAASRVSRTLRLATLNSTTYSHASTDTPSVEGVAWTWEAHEDAPRAPVPPFDAATALQKVKAAEAAWNSRDAKKVAQAYSPDSVWRNRGEIFRGRDEIEKFLTQKWQNEHEYRLEKNLWSFSGNRIGARFEYEWKDSQGQHWRTHGNEQWEFDNRGYMRWRDMSANDIPIEAHERRL